MSLKKSMWSCSFKLKKPHYTIQPGDREDYQPKTLHRHNQQRRQFLPTFPNSLEQSMYRAPLLLANVSAQKLSTIELTRRTSAAFVDPFNPKFIQKVPSYIYIEFQNLYGPLKTRLNVDAAILDYNLYRIYEIIDVFIAKYQFYEGFNVLFDHHFQLPIHDQHLRKLKQNELIVLLEFFLQIDVDVFNMKTCIFRKTDQPLFINSLFSTDEITEYSYDMKPCGRLFCRLCQSNEDQCSQQMIEFSTSGHKHRFVNGYEAILNCPANCRTNNIIYVLTCTCGEYDYIGSTQHTLDDVIEYHRQNANRIITEYLLNGEPFPNKCTCIPNEFHKQRANKMRLYQHLMHCSKALQLFLEDNPEYGCFIPMRMNEAQFDDLSYATTLTQVDNETQNSMEIDTYLAHVPKPPVNFSFSKRQHDEQRQFFQKFNCKQHSSYSTLDFYHATIVAVLPDHCSTMLRHVIEILFITHAETKLNSMNLYTGNNNDLYGVPYKSDRIWCDDLSYPTLE